MARSHFNTELRANSAGCEDSGIFTMDTPYMFVHHHQILERLPASYRRVVDEVDLAERPVSEVAAELNKSPGAIHMLRSRAHERLRELLGGPTRFFGDSS